MGWCVYTAGGVACGFCIEAGSSFCFWSWWIYHFPGIHWSMCILSLTSPLTLVFQNVVFDVDVPVRLLLNQRPGFPPGFFILSNLDSSPVGNLSIQSGPSQVVEFNVGLSKVET